MYGRKANALLAKARAVVQHVQLVVERDDVDDARRHRVAALGAWSPALRAWSPAHRLAQPVVIARAAGGWRMRMTVAAAGVLALGAAVQYTRDKPRPDSRRHAAPTRRPLQTNIQLPSYEASET